MDDFDAPAPLDLQLSRDVAGSGGEPPRPIDELVRGVVRNMMGPLDVVLGFSDMLQETSETEQRERFLGHVRWAAGQLRQQLDRLEKLTRPRVVRHQQLELFDEPRSR